MEGVLLLLGEVVDECLPDIIGSPCLGYIMFEANEEGVEARSGLECVCVYIYICICVCVCMCICDMSIHTSIRSRSERLSASAPVTLR